MICGNCGFNNNDSVAFCSNCGAALVENQPIQEPVAQPAQEPVAQPAQEPVVQPAQPQYQQPYAQQYQQSYQQPYQQPVYPQHQQKQEDVSETVSMKEWLLSFLILCIPFANIIMPFIWAFSGNSKKSKSNYFKAYLIWMLIMYILLFVGLFVLIAIFTTVGTSAPESITDIPFYYY